MAINLGIKRFHRFLWLHNDKRNKCVEKCSKYSCATATLLVKIIEKYLQCRSNCSQMFFKSRCSLKICKLCKFHMKAPVLEYLFNRLGPSQLYYKETPTQGFSYEICEIFKDIFFFFLAASGNGSSIFGKVVGYIFYLKSWTSFTKDFCRNFKKALFQKSLSRSTFAECFSTVAYWKIENHVSLFERKKRKEND